MVNVLFVTVKLTVASKISNGQSPGELQLMVMRRNPGQDPLEDAALSAFKQLLHGLICTTERRQVTAQRWCRSRLLTAGQKIGMNDLTDNFSSVCAIRQQGCNLSDCPATTHIGEERS